MIPEDIARANGALNTPEAIATLIDLSRGASPEDAYLEHVCGVNKAGLICILPMFKAAVRYVPDFEEIYKQFSVWMPKIQIPTVWHTFLSFYKPLVNAGLLNGKYEITQQGKEIAESLEKLMQE